MSRREAAEAVREVRAWLRVEPSSDLAHGMLAQCLLYDEQAPEAIREIQIATFTDGSVLASTAYSYTVQARDAVNNVSAVSAGASTTTPAAAAPVFGDGFESGTLGAWTSSAGGATCDR